MAVRGGLLTLADVSERYNISVDEYLTWQDALDPPLWSRITYTYCAIELFRTSTNGIRL
jgi:hypothetical protein